MKRIVLCVMGIFMFLQDMCMEQGNTQQVDREMQKAQDRVRRWVDSQVALHRLRVLQEQLKLPDTLEQVKR